MKKILLSTALVLCALCAMAQPRAIGIRFGYDNGFSYQHTVDSKNMVNLELGYISFNGVQVSATYDWIFPINTWTKAGEWNWFAGVGGGASFMQIQDPGVFIGLAARIGVEYNFKFPLNLSLDWRPMFGPTVYYKRNNIIGYSGADIAGFAFSVRYNFGK